MLYADQLADEILASTEGATRRRRRDRDYKKKKIDTDFSGFGGMMKLMEVLIGGEAVGGAGNKPKIAVVYAVGPITEGKSQQRHCSAARRSARPRIIEALRKAADDPKVVAIVLRIDSPGGSATASDLIWRETVRTEKPVVASMGDVAGSGGYYIAMGARKIFAEPGTLTGSIGVIGGKLVTGGLYDKLGLNTEVISRGANSGALSSTQPFTPEERKVWIELLQETYHQFVSKAAEGRKMPYNKLEALAQGRVYTGRMAKKLGLVDELGTLHDAVAAAKTGRRAEGRRGGRAARPARAQDRSSSNCWAIRPPVKWTRCCPRRPDFLTGGRASTLAVATRADLDALRAGSQIATPAPPARVPPACPVDAYARSYPPPPLLPPECHRLARWMLTLVAGGQLAGVLHAVKPAPGSPEPLKAVARSLAGFGLNLAPRQPAMVLDPTPPEVRHHEQHVLALAQPLGDLSNVGQLLHVRLAPLADLVPGSPAQPVELRHHQHVAGLRVEEQPAAFRPVPNVHAPA